MKSGEFRLPGRKALQPSDTTFEVVLINATEQPIERPKKSSGSTIVAKRSGTLKTDRCSGTISKPWTNRIWDIDHRREEKLDADQTDARRE